jgi:hypothetical protein
MAKKIAPKGNDGRLTRRQIGALSRNVTRKMASNYARRVSVGGKGG